jgi:hypothetical protein
MHGLLDDDRAGASSVLIVQGEAGSGKTAPLDISPPMPRVSACSAGRRSIRRIAKALRR